jgi:hypothetical protein
MLKNILKIEGIQEISIVEQKNLLGGGVLPPPHLICASSVGPCRIYSIFCVESHCHHKPVIGFPSHK